VRKKNDPEFAAELAKLGDIFVSDTFSTAHRAHASVEALARIMPSCAGRLMEEEISRLENALSSPKKTCNGSSWWRKGIFQIAFIGKPNKPNG